MEVSQIDRRRIDINRLSAAIRTKRGNRTFREVEKEAGISWSQLRKFEERSRVPGLDNYMQLCGWLQVEMDFFVTTEPSGVAS